MYDLKTPHTDSAWALDGLDTQEDSGLQEMHKQSGRKGKKTARPTRLAAAKNVSYAEDQDCDISEDADDEADRTAEEPKDKEDEDKDEGEIDDGVRHRPLSTWLVHNSTDDPSTKGLPNQPCCLQVKRPQTWSSPRQGH